MSAQHTPGPWEPEIPVLEVRPCALCQRSEAGYVCTGACEDANREMRAEFEAQAKTVGLNLDWNERYEHYYSKETRVAWWAWESALSREQAARASVKPQEPEAIAQLRHLVDDIAVVALFKNREGENEERYIIRPSAGLLFSNMVAAVKGLLAPQPQTQPSTEPKCSLGCTTECKAKVHGCASECPALPWQPTTGGEAITDEQIEQFARDAGIPEQITLESGAIYFPHIGVVRAVRAILAIASGTTK